MHNNRQSSVRVVSPTMDESWRMRMGAGTKTRPKPNPNLPRRRSTEETSARRAVFDSQTLLHPDDFTDVFGGPPRTVLSRQFSTADFAKSSNPFYEEIFRETTAPMIGKGRNLPEFRIPASRERSDRFYSDIFGKKNDADVRRSRSRSKSNSSSVLSSEQLSPLRPEVTAADDFSISSFASKLRPINIPCRLNSSTMMPNEHPMQQEMPYFVPCSRSSHFDDQFPQSEHIDNFRSSHFGFSRLVSSPEISSIEPNSYRNVKVSMDDLELNSPSSVVSSLCQDHEVKTSKVQYKGWGEQEMEQEEDEVMSSYVIEINADHREGTEEEALGVDEAIAWAKEKFYTHHSDQIWSKCEKDQSADAEGFSDGQMDRQGATQSLLEEEPNKWAPEGRELEKDMEMEVLDEGIRLWSASKEANIRLLLSTLHQILWPDSGWYEIHITNLVESSQVKKAYQKARLCLHPDKLQQRGATFMQKYVAEKAFSILQKMEAWAAYISQDFFFS
ncbi:unnamed protein product [Camellia sinensis]